MKSTLQDKLRDGRFVITAEVTPPVSTDRGEMLAKAAEIITSVVVNQVDFMIDR